jgi:hypothetical protein
VSSWEQRLIENDAFMYAVNEYGSHRIVQTPTYNVLFEACFIKGQIFNGASLGHRVVPFISGL